MKNTFFGRVSDSKLIQFLFDSSLGGFILWSVLVIVFTRWFGRDLFFKVVAPLLESLSLDGSACSLSELSIFYFFFGLGCLYILNSVFDLLLFFESLWKKWRSRSI